MRNLQRPRSHPVPNAHPRLQLIADGVVAGYIHDISIRHGSGGSEPRPRRRRCDRRQVRGLTPDGAAA